MAEDFSAVTKQLIADRQARQKELEVQKELLSKMSTELETAGMKAEDNAEYNKKSLELDKQQLKFRLNGADNPAARKEIKAEQAAAAKKNQGLLGKIAGGVTGMFGKMMAPVKGAGKGIMKMLKGTLVAGLLLAVLAFLESPYWEQTKKIIVEDILPLIQSFWKFLSDHWEVILTGIVAVKAVLIGMKVVELFKKISAGYKALKAATIKNVLDPLKNSAFGQKVIELFKKMWLAIKAGYIALKAKTMTNVLEPLKNAAKGVAAQFWNFMKLIPPALVALKVFFLSTFLPAVTAFMVPLLPFIAIAAAIGVALYALWNAFEDFQKTLDETGSIGEALKVGIAKFMGTILGFIPAMILKLVGWVAGLFGFDDFKAKVATIDPIQWISDTIKGVFDKVHKWFTQLFTDPVGAIVSLVGGYLSIFTDFGGWVYRKALKPAIDWIGGLFGVTDASGGLETWVGDKIKILKDFGGWVYEKAIKPVIDWIGGLFTWATPALEGGWTNLAAFVTGVWTKVKTWFTNLFSWASTEDDKDSFVIKTVKDAVTGAKEWLGKMFKFDSASDILTSLFNAAFFLPNLVKDGLLSVTSWLLSLFGFDDAAKGVANAKNFTIGGMIVGVITSIVDWLADVFDIDFKKIMLSIIPGGAMGKKVLGWFGFGSGPDKPAPDTGAEEEAKKAEELEKKAGILRELDEKITKQESNVKKQEERLAKATKKKRYTKGIEKGLEKRQERLDELKAAKAEITGPDEAEITGPDEAEITGPLTKEQLLKMSMKEIRKAAIDGKAKWSDYRAAKVRRRKKRQQMLNDDAVMRRDRAQSGEESLDAFDVHGASLLEKRALQAPGEKTNIFGQLERPSASQAKRQMALDGGTDAEIKQRAKQIQESGLKRGAAASGSAPAVVNAPVNTINNSQSNTTVASTELKHPSAILNKVNLAA